jgi:hypothetical protein
MSDMYNIWTIGTEPTGDFSFFMWMTPNGNDIETSVLFLMNNIVPVCDLNCFERLQSLKKVTEGCLACWGTRTGPVIFKTQKMTIGTQSM